MRNRLGNKNGVTIFELVIVMAMSVFLLAWIMHPIRGAKVVKGYADLEMLQRQEYKLLNPVIEDIREATARSFSWVNLDPSQPSPSVYNPKNFPWFSVQDPGLNPTFPRTFICYYFDDASQSLKRVKSTVAIVDPVATACSVTATNPPGEETIIATNLLTPTAAQPFFRGDSINSSVYFILRVPLGSGGDSNQGGGLADVLTVNRMGTVRN